VKASASHISNIDRVKVLIVDNEYHTRKVIRVLLLGMGCTRIFEASDGEAGLAAIRAVHPEVALLDWDIPAMSGGEFVRTLQSDPAFSESRPAIIMMVAHNKRSRVLEAVRLGVHEFLLKPVSIAALRARMLAALGKAAARKAKSERSEARKLAGGIGALL
jgi:two-component system, chemotaxis family, chemotaxis protein CheY